MKDYKNAGWEMLAEGEFDEEITRWIMEGEFDEAVKLRIKKIEEELKADPPSFKEVEQNIAGYCHDCTMVKVDGGCAGCPIKVAYDALQKAKLNFGK